MIRNKDIIFQYTIDINSQLILINSFQEKFLSLEEVNLLENEYSFLTSIIEEANLINRYKIIQERGQPELIDGRKTFDIFDAEGEKIGTEKYPQHLEYDTAVKAIENISEPVNLLSNSVVIVGDNISIRDDLFLLFQGTLPNVQIDIDSYQNKINENNRNIAIDSISIAANAITEQIYSYVPDMEYNSFITRVAEARWIISVDLSEQTEEEIIRNAPILSREASITGQPLEEIGVWVSNEGDLLEAFSGIVAGEVRSLANEVRALRDDVDFISYTNEKNKEMVTRLLAILGR